MNLSKISIKQKFTFSLMMAVIVSTLLVGTISQWNARELVSERIETVELPNLLMKIRNQIDKEISLMQGVTEQLASDSFIQHWMEDGYDPQQESYVVDFLQRIQKQHNLTNVSVADR